MELNAALPKWFRSRSACFKTAHRGTNDRTLRRAVLRVVSRTNFSILREKSRRNKKESFSSPRALCASSEAKVYDDAQACCGATGRGGRAQVRITILSSSQTRTTTATRYRACGCFVHAAAPCWRWAKFDLKLSRCSLAFVTNSLTRQTGASRKWLTDALHLSPHLPAR